MAVENKETKKELIRIAAEADLETFIHLVHPNRVLGSIHSEVIDWWYRPEAKSHQLLLLPRDHQKSALIAYRVVFELTKNPALKFLYISSTSNLAVKQLYFMKGIMTSPIYRFYWPEMVNVEESKREKWTETEISVDHPKRKEESIRDPSIFVAGLTTNVTGLHCNVAVLDDVVVHANAYTEEGRATVEQQYGFLASIETTESSEWVVGTRYHPKDLYEQMIARRLEVYDDKGEFLREEPLYDTFEREVENIGDGSGEFLWPRQSNGKGQWFGFDQNILAKKRAQYLDPVLFRAQYYNDPNDLSGVGITTDCFQYYDRAHLQQRNGRWVFNGKRLNVFAAIDFAFSLDKRADYTAIVVVGVDSDNNYYILDVDRFKTDAQIADYYKHIFFLHNKWGFNKIRAEVNVAQQAIVNDLKTNYIRRHGLALSIDEHRPSRAMGNKEERIAATLRPRYQNRQIWHYQGGHCQTLEEELLLANPAHDDIKDALCCCIDICVAPSVYKEFSSAPLELDRSFSRFGGLA